MVPKIRRPGAQVKVVSDYLVQRDFASSQRAYFAYFSMIVELSIGRSTRRFFAEAALTKAKFSIKRQIVAQSTCFDCGQP